MNNSRCCVVIDDSKVIREILTRILTEFDLEAAAFASADPALEYCRENPPAVILLDWDLPSFGALDFLKTLMTIEMEARPEIILLATENDEQQMSLARAAGAAYHILKPFDKASIEEKLSEIGLISSQSEPAQSAARQ